MGLIDTMREEWLPEVFQPNGRDPADYMQVVADVPATKDEGRRFTFILHTNAGEYSITATEPHGDRKGYLGCVFNSRTYEPGENWVRGNDMWDGELGVKTFFNIIHDIFCSELLKPKPGVKRTIRERTAAPDIRKG